jgi:hypothetical protein
LLYHKPSGMKEAEGGCAVSCEIKFQTGTESSAVVHFSVLKDQTHWELRKHVRPCKISMTSALVSLHTIYDPWQGSRYRGWIRVLCPKGRRSSPEMVQTGSGAHQASYPIGTGGSFAGGNAAGA